MDCKLEDFRYLVAPSFAASLFSGLLLGMTEVLIEIVLQQSGQVDDLMYNQFEVPGRKDLPPQGKWSYDLKHYIQYLVDLQATHHVLESSIAEALAAHQGTGACSKGHLESLHGCCNALHSLHWLLHTHWTFHL